MADPFRAYEFWQARHKSANAQGGVASFLLGLVRKPPPPGDGEEVILVDDNGEQLEVRIAWSFDKAYGGGRGLLRIRDVRSPGDPPPASV